MSILVIGARGNMGRRYGSILTYLGKEWSGVDAEHNRHFVKDVAAKADGVIIATPTDTHASLIHLCADLGKPILCEKPLTKDMGEMSRVAQAVKDHATNLTMVYQYKEIIDPSSIGWTYYNNWSHGKDGLIWDCIQIIGLARSEVTLQEDSPLWRCRINGRKLHIQDMDRAYITMMSKWLRNPGQDIGEIKAIHEKVDAFDREVKRATD